MNICPPAHFSIDSSLRVAMQVICLCSDGAKFLASTDFRPNIRIQPTLESAAHTLYNATHATINIPQKNIVNDDGFKSLIVELFNAKIHPPQHDNLLKKSSLGCTGMDSFAQQMESVEKKQTKKRITLHDRCQSLWGDLLTDEDRDQHLKDFYLEAGGHTNTYRHYWMDNFKENYCNKNPDDVRSCQTTKEQLIGFFRVQSMNPIDKVKFLTDRICQLYPCAHKNVKKDSFYKEHVTKHCPDSLLPRTDCPKKISKKEESCPELESANKSQFSHLPIADL
ncbi:MAG: hypothetical protein K2Y01_09095 [Rhabdochlamydiaceae bacterium]|nr:hypothetical protein [Rhabdochlamydiaceae bacterium]